MATNTSDTEGPIQQLELLLQSGEAIEQENFDSKVAAAFKGRLGGFYQLYLFAITFVHTTSLIPGSLPFSDFTSAFQIEGMHIYRYALSSQETDEYGITATKFSIPKQRETIAYMLDVLHNVEYLAASFPPEESSYDPVTHQQLHLLCQNNGCVGLRGEPRPVLTVFRIILAAELFQRYLPAFLNHREALLYETVKWWWTNGEFHENYPDFEDSSAMAADDYPGVFGKLLRRLGDTRPNADPQSRVEPCLIYPYLIRQSQTKPWMSGMLPSTNGQRHHRGPSAMGDIEIFKSNALEAIVEESSNSPEQNPPRSTNTFSVPEVSGSLESSQKGQTEELPPHRETSSAAPSRSTNTFTVPDSPIESSASPGAGDTGVEPPAVSSTREETVNSEEQIATTHPVSHSSPATEEAPIFRDKDPVVSTPAPDIQNTHNPLETSPQSDTSIITVIRVEASGDARSPSQQLHETGREGPPDTPSKNRPDSPQPLHQVIDESVVAGPKSGSSPVLQESPSDPPNNPQSTCAAIELENFSNVPDRPANVSATSVPQSSSPQPLRRSGRQRREPERYAPALRQQRRVTNNEWAGKRPTIEGRTGNQNRSRQRKNERKSAVTKKPPAKRQRRPATGASARRRKPTISSSRTLADVPVLEVLSVSTRGRLRKVPQKYGV